MKKIFIPLLTVGIVAAILFAGCMPGAPPAPPVTPPVTPPGVVTDKAGVPLPEEIVGLVDPDKVLMNPWPEGDFAVKPDGTPYQLTLIMYWLGDDWQIGMQGVTSHIFEMAGGITKTLDCDLVMANQIAHIEDEAAAGITDAMCTEPIDENALNPSIAAAKTMGTPMFTFACELTSPDVAGKVNYTFEGPNGVWVCGDYFRKLAEETGKPAVVLELWGGHEFDTSYRRSLGFLRGLAGIKGTGTTTIEELLVAIENDPLVTVIQSPDTLFNPEKMMDAIVNLYGSHPEINGIYAHGGDATGIINGLKAVDRYYPVGHPQHVTVVPQDVDRSAMAALKEGYIDAIGGTGPFQVGDALAKMIMTYVVLGQPVPFLVDAPVALVTAEDWQEVRVWGGTGCFVEMPMGEWDKWPVLDTSEFGLPTPTKAMRMELLGY
jgi:ABC-type sugar transport system substrate-binding protein